MEKSPYFSKDIHNFADSFGYEFDSFGYEFNEFCSTAKILNLNKLFILKNLSNFIPFLFLSLSLSLSCRFYC